jgi:hypothetical protein
MKWKNINLRKGLYILSALILLAGAAGAALIYWAAMNDSPSDGGYEVIGGYIYPGPSENSKRYIHDLQLYGGNAAVLADGFMRWFGGLWHGTALAYTVACISILISFVVFVTANNVPSRLTIGVPAKNGGTKADE